MKVQWPIDDSSIRLLNELLDGSNPEQLDEAAIAGVGRGISACHALRGAVAHEGKRVGANHLAWANTERPLQRLGLPNPAEHSP